MAAEGVACPQDGSPENEDGKGARGEGGHRVLVVDDHDDSCELFAMALTLAGHEVTTASDGEEALAAILAGGFDVAVLDVSLPNLDGPEVARRARRGLGESTPYLVGLSGYSPASRDNRESPFDVYFVKPVEMASLLAAVASARTAARGSMGSEGPRIGK